MTGYVRSVILIPMGDDRKSEVQDRRAFLLQALKMSGQIALASSAVYSAGLFVQKALPDASMVAGAKTCGWTSTFAGVEAACSAPDPLPSDPCSATALWWGCTAGGSPGIVEQWECFCN